VSVGAFGAVHTEYKGLHGHRMVFSLVQTCCPPSAKIELVKKAAAKQAI
jgi:hypothetical protein